MREELKRLILTAKVLQFCADIFAVFGIILFAYIYFHNYSDNPATAIRDPLFIVTVLIPFVPAAVMAWMASKKRKQIRTLVESASK